MTTETGNLALKTVDPANTVMDSATSDTRGRWLVLAAAFLGWMFDGVRHGRRMVARSCAGHGGLARGKTAFACRGDRRRGECRFCADRGGGVVFQGHARLLALGHGCWRGSGVACLGNTILRAGI